MAAAGWLLTCSTVLLWRMRLDTVAEMTGQQASWGRGFLCASADTTEITEFQGLKVWICSNTRAYGAPVTTRTTAFTTTVTQNAAPFLSGDRDPVRSSDNQAGFQRPTAVAQTTSGLILLRGFRPPLVKLLCESSLPSRSALNVKVKPDPALCSGLNLRAWDVNSVWKRSADPPAGRGANLTSSI
ncbi:hypothetical protein MHYP_G00018910 [Metynnis hypsauchen]